MLRTTQRSLPAGLLVAALSVAAITALIYPLREAVPVVSTGVLYLLAVLLVSSYWGRWLGLATAVASVLAFNYFHIPPTGRLTVSEGENWLALAVYLVAAVVASALADSARSRALEAERRRGEAELLTEMARLLLGGRGTADSLSLVARRLSVALGLPSASIELGSAAGGERQTAIPLEHEGERIGTLLVPADAPPEALARLRERVAPGLETLLAAALQRDRLGAEAIEAKALRRSDVVKTALLRSVSHDLRSPLTAIAAAGVGIESPTISTEERREMAEIVVAEAARLSRLVDNLLDLSRLQSGGAEPHRDWVALDELLRTAADSASGDPGNIELRLDDLPLVRADPAQLERAFANLLDNACRYSGDQPVLVRGRAGDGTVRLRMVDRGPGIPAHRLQHVFEPFYRVEGEGRAQGSGLGLAIARGFIEANGGRVWAESLPGQGTTMVVELPLPEAERDEPTSAAPAAKAKA